MTATLAKKKADTETLPEVDPLLKRPIPHAYALVPHPTRQGLYYTVHLEGVVAERLEHLEFSKRAEAAPYGMQRIEAAMQRRHHHKKWG
jgi:hypothetical protein